MIHSVFSPAKKFSIAATTAFLMFLWSMNPVSGADKAVVCNDSGCSGFDSALFTNSNAVPGDSVSKTFSIKNDKGESLSINLRPAKDAGTDDAFLEVISAVVYKSPSEILFSGFMDNFLDGNLIGLGSIGPGETKDYEIEISLSNGAGNEFQGSAVNFSLSLEITGEETGTTQVLGTSTSSNSGTSGSSTNSIVGQVLGLSDTSSEIFKVIFYIMGALLILEGAKMILNSKRAKE